MLPTQHFLAFMMVSVFFLLSSCSSQVHKKDGPPDFYVDETKIPNAVPKNEPLAKYGNMRSYQVFGKRYFVMANNANYEAIGKASWYGTKFHHQRTSSGEPYDMLGMTAAHKTLPLPTYVLVTNLANQKQVIVKVNDRGPFSGDRLIDLSYVAAKKLGMLGHGTTMVKVKALHPWNYQAAVRPKKNILPGKQFAHWNAKVQHYARGEKRIYLQIGAFSQFRNAVKFQERIVRFIANTVIISRALEDHSYYRVQIGPVNALQAAEINAELQRLGIKANKITGA